MCNSQVRMLSVLVILLVFGAGTVSAQSLEKRSRLELRLGMAVHTNAGVEVSVDGVETDVSTGNFLGAIGYSYWLSEPWAISFSAGAVSLNVDTRVSAGSVNTSSKILSQLMVGVRYYFVKSTLTGTHRPYFSLEAGPVIGSQSAVIVGTSVVVEDRSETTIGARPGVGFDILLSNRWMLGLSGGYLLMADFSNEFAGRKNHSGPDFGGSISFLFGGGK